MKKLSKQANAELADGHSFTVLVLLKLNNQNVTLSYGFKIAQVQACLVLQSRYCTKGHGHGETVQKALQGCVDRFTVESHIFV